MKHSVKEYQLASGARGLVVDVPSSAVVNIRVTFHSGYQFADSSSYEVPHIMEHVLATVSQRHSEPNSFMIEAQKNGAYANATTSADTNEYIYECAAFEKDRILDLLEEQLCEPLFDEKAFKAEKGNVREELTRNTTQHMSVCNMALAERAFPKQWKNYEARLEQLPDISLGQLEAHYRRTHTASNARFYVAGDFDDGGEAVASRIERIFGRLKPGKRLKLSRDIGQGSDGPIVVQRDIDQLYYRTSHYFGGLTEPERAVLSILRMVMVGGMGSRVLGEARRRGLAYSVGASGHSEPGNGSFGFSGYVTPGNAEELFEVVNRSMREVAAGGCSAQECAAAQDLLVGSVTRSTQTAGDIMAWYVDKYDDEGIVRDYENGLALLRSVTAEQVSALANDILASPRHGSCLLGRLEPEFVSKLAGQLDKA